VNVGTASASASYAGDANHNGDSGSDTFAIVKAPSLVTVTCPTTDQTYTGAAQTPCTAKATGVGGLDVTLTPAYSDNVNVGTASASASYAGDANHNGDSGSDTFAIVKAPSLVTVTCPTAVQTYTGSPIEPCTAKATGVGGLNVTLTPTYTNNTAVGIATASASYGGDTNHTGSSGSNTFTIAYKTCLLYDPTKSYKAGSTAPLKFYLCDASGNDVSNSAIVVQATSLSKVDNTASGVLEDSGYANSPENNFRYDATLGPTGGYIFNLSTKSPSPALGQKNALSTGTWKLSLTVNGAGGYSLQFDVK
jgi:hypothetical protein